MNKANVVLLYGAGERDDDRARGEYILKAGGNIAYFANHIPEFVEDAIEHLYHHRFASLAHFRVYGGCEDASTYVAYDEAEITALFLFKKTDGVVRVANEGIRIGERDVSDFSEFIFSRFRDARKIVFHAVELDDIRLKHPCHRVVLAENTVATLPATPEEYKARLGKSTRAYLNRYLSKLKREIPDFQFITIERGDIFDHHVKDLVRWNQQRMANKNKSTRHTESNTWLMIQYAKQRGLIGAIVLGGKICASVLTYQAGNGYFMEMISHDPLYDDYRLGTLCCYLTICECIRRGARKYYFMWGRYDYKYRLLGEKQDLADLVVYRSKATYVFDVRRIVGDKMKSHVQRFKLWTHEVKPENGTLARLALRGLNAWFKMRQIVTLRQGHD